MRTGCRCVLKWYWIECFHAQKAQNTVFRLSSPHLGSNSKNLSLFDLGSKAIPFMRGVNRGMQICRSVMVYWPNPPLKFRPESEMRKIFFCFTQNPKSGPKKWMMNESAIRCNCRIRKSVKILLWIRNPGKTGKDIFKIHRSVRLFIPPLYELACITGVIFRVFQASKGNLAKARRVAPDTRDGRRPCACASRLSSLAWNLKTRKT